MLKNNAAVHWTMVYYPIIGIAKMLRFLLKEIIRYFLAPLLSIKVKITAY